MKQGNETVDRQDPAGPVPRRELPFACSRRSFLPALLREALVTLDLACGQRGGRLAGLGELPDRELGTIRPVVNPAYEILVEDDQVWGRYRGTDKIVHLFSLAEKETLLAFNLFDGQHTLDQAGQRLAQETGWEGERAFAYVRDLFLTLVGYLVCLPKDPPPDGKSELGPGKD
jgi:hypothetical protein